MSNTDIPAQEVELDTKRQRLYHVTWLNRIRLDKQLRPLLYDIEHGPGDGGRMGVLFKATFRGAITLINHYLHFDIREHPSAIFLIMLKLVDDRSFDSIWNDYSPMIQWVNNDNVTEPNSSSEVSPTTEYEQQLLQYDPSGGLPDANGRNERVWQDDIQQNTSERSGRKKAHSDTGQQT